MGVIIFKINPQHIKVHDQYVECCCTQEEKTKLQTRLKEIHGVTHVELVNEPESKGIDVKTNYYFYSFIVFN